MRTVKDDVVTGQPVKRTRRASYSPAEADTLRRLYPDNTAAAVATALAWTVQKVYGVANALGIRKSEAFLSSASSGRTDGTRGTATRFVKGQQSWNRGVKGICGVHPNSKRTQFKKGQRRGAAQRNYVPVGSHRISADGYLERKVNDTHPVPARRWVAVHRLVWEAVHGPVIEGHVICFLPGKKTAILECITVDVLEQVSRADLARRNHPRNHSPEFAQVVQLKGAITRQVNRIVRAEKEKQS
ncbi:MULTISPECIES: HNH endonuclease [Pandoraea]|uniref:HNH endonuclease n=1 Tax=Pandoraea TaxID=93217 RepID=UPI001F5D8471|nr:MULTISPECIES: HNH endonuclease [Pandoraea]MCI3205854.1 HNH endonuclease [Pandoraea sp. LA3]MDN4583882.1 HNH endonuclease [Pandoraea capi]